jgi:two-component system phosphate regulon sensor histidine kinase PhoR
MNEIARPAPDISLLSALIEALRDPAAIVGAETRILAANAALRALVPILRTGDLLVLSLRSPDVLDAVARVQAGGERETVLWRERVPVERVFEVAVAPVEATGFPRCVVITLRDLTEARRVERMRVDFIANASHELRTPLASLLGFIDTLQGAARTDEVARGRFLAIMRDQARRMTRLIEDLLSLSRIEQNEHLRPDTPVDIVAVVGHVIDTLGPLAQENGVEIDFTAPDELFVTGDRDELVRVAENLIENAIKYGGEEGASQKRVDIVIAEDSGKATFDVRDYGPGIPAEHLPRLTERFYRVDAGASRAKGGTGLGLAIVKHIVARHRGRLTIDSRQHQGAKFSVTLPLDKKT